MNYILCIETSTDICSVCIAKEGKLLSLRETERTYSHSEVITVFINQCLQEANISMSDLNAVAISAGPGSYTALRIGSSTAKGICYAMNIPLIAIDTMTAIAKGVADHTGQGELIIPLLDARRKEVYAAVYDYQMTQIKAVSPLILTENSFSEYRSVGNIHFCGDGVAKTKEILTLKNAIYHESEASSKHMIDEAFVKYTTKIVADTAYFTPFYYKAPNITVQKKNILFPKK